ncbi:hypothetical protein GYB22_09180 [bacterium]|nr:hypothetical protein [bacterium]
MKLFNITILSLVLLLGACKDEINDPNPDTEPVIDNTKPTIEVISPVADSNYSFMDTFPVKVIYKDDFILENLQFVLEPTNVAGDLMNIAIQTEDSMFTLDTFYILPQNDTLNMRAIIKARDFAQNQEELNYNFNVYK